MKKRLLSALLALCMMLTMMPTVAFAVDVDDVPDSSAGTEMSESSENAEVPESSGNTEASESGWKTDDEQKTVSIYTAAGLRAWADAVRESNNQYDGYTISIENDIDLSEKNWTSIISLGGTVTIDGKNHTISNMTISEQKNGSDGNTYLGFIGNLNYNTKLTVKDITFANAHVQDPGGDAEYSWCGAVVGHGPMDGVNASQAECTFTNVKIVNSVVTGGHNNGAIMGYSCSTETGILFENCSVTDTFVGGYNSTSGILFGMGIANVTVRDCTADGVQLYTDGLNCNCSQSWDDQLWLGNVYPEEIYGDRYGSNGKATYDGTNDAGDSCVVYPVYFHVYNSSNQVEVVKKYVPVNTDLSKFDSWFAGYPDSSPTWYSDEDCTKAVTQIVADLTDNDMYPYGKQSLENDEAYATQHTEQVTNPLTHGAIELYQKKIVTPAWEASKSKTATNLDENYESEVTLSLPAADYEPEIDVVFVIDDTSATSSIFAESAKGLLAELRSKENLDINFGLVTFDAIARDWLEVTSNGEISGLVSLSDDNNYTAICNAIETTFTSNGEGEEKRLGGTNTEWPLAMAQEMLAEGTGSEQHVIMFSDMYGYVYRGDLTVDGTTYENVPLSKRLGNYNLGQLCISPPKYDIWENVYKNRADDEASLDTFFRDTSWDNYWAIYTNVNPAPDINQAPDNSAPQYVPGSNPQEPFYYFTPFEKSSCLTYDRIQSLLDAEIQVTVVNNDFNPGENGETIQNIKDGMLDDLAAKGVMVIQEETENGASFSSDQMGNIFSALEDKLIQVVDAGSKVVDVIGEGTDNHGKPYNFDFVDDAASLILTVGGNQYTATPVTEELDTGETARYNFTYEGVTATNGAAAPFVLHYYKDGTNVEGTTSGECFVWDINVPVTKEATVQLTYTVKLTDPQEAAGIYGQYDTDGSEEYAGLYTNNSATLYPVDSNGDQGVPENFAKPTVSYTAGAVELQVQDITVYTGGEGADGVINDDTGDESDVEGEKSNGLPTPGYTLVLPGDVNKKLADLIDQSEDAVSNGYVDLSKYLTFTYSYDGETRNWPLAVYEDGDYSGIKSTLPNGQHVYRIEPATVGDEKIPIRLEFHALDADGKPIGDPIISDDFDANATNLYDKYSMTIYAGALNQGLVKANLKIGDETYVFGVEIESGTLTVRGVEDNSANHPVQDNHEAVSDNTNAVDRGTTVTAVDSNKADTTYYINEDKSVTVDPDNVHLLADSTLENDTPLKDYLLEKDHADSGSEIQLLYLDLVDNSNGNAVVVPSQPLDIYWKIPNDANVNGDFRLVHFEGLDREYDGAKLDEILDSGKLPSGETGGTSETLTFPVFTTTKDEHGVLDKVQIDGAWYLRFATQDFSPFALIYDRQNGGSTGGGGGGSNKPDDLNTEDHFAYIIGYPKDYRTGEPTDDESRWPVEPQGNITRAEVATIFFRMLTDEARDENWSQTNSYTDVASTDWYNNAISTLSNMGIISGDPSGAFRPDDSITRAEFTKIAVGFFDKAGDYVDGTYEDVSSSDWYADFIDAAVDLGLIEGYPDGTIRPEATITRAEACTIVNRTLGRVPDKDHLLPTDEMRVWPDNSDTNEWYYAQIQEATNSHDYEWIGEENDQIENWTEKLEDRDWAQLEREWSDANSAPGGEVVD